MKTLKLLIVAIFISFSAFAQNSNLDFKYALKGYNHTSFFKRTQTDSWSSYNSKYLNLFDPVIGLHWQTKQNNAHEVTLRGISGHVSKGNTATFDTIRSNDTGNSFGLSLGYEYLLLFNKTKETQLIPSVGFGINPYFNYYRYHVISSTFDANGSNTTIGANIMITPRLLYFFSPRFFGDINIPFYLANVRHDSHQEIRNPTADMNMNSTSTEFEAFPKIYNLRIGIGLKL